jgi:hypothetical protein
MGHETLGEQSLPRSLLFTRYVLVRTTGMGLTCQDGWGNCDVWPTVDDIMVVAIGDDVTRIALFCLLAAFAAISGSVIAQDHSAEAAGQPFIATIRVESPATKIGEESYVLKVGSELFITVHITNVSKHNLAFDYDSDSRTGVSFAHRYEVRTSRGMSAEKRTISHPEIGSTGHGWPAQVLKPGESMDINGDHISSLYDLSLPDEYTIQLWRAFRDDPKSGFVKSNTITVTVAK